MLLSDKYPFLTEYFEKGIKNKLDNSGVPIAHSLLFYGKDFESQYKIAKEIARLLNCSGDHSDKCDCINCRWIREDKHPAVLTISKVDNKTADDDTKTVISIKQSEMIKKSLMTTSEFYRVFIFCDKDENGIIQGLNQQNFQDETANSMLKIIEEPNDRVMFIFLASNIEDIIPTIVSRSQCFRVSNVGSEDFSFNKIKPFFENYWNFERKDVFDIASKLLSISDITPLEILTEMQYYILSVLKENPNNAFLIQHVKDIEISKKEFTLGMNAQNVFENLCLKLIK